LDSFSIACDPNASREQNECSVEFCFGLGQLEVSAVNLYTGQQAQVELAMPNQCSYRADLSVTGVREKCVRPTRALGSKPGWTRSCYYNHWIEDDDGDTFTLKRPGQVTTVTG
ncbi:hypothetical protein SARC_14419, partial [Sphaeroforma arctica JP610]